MGTALAILLLIGFFVVLPMIIHAVTAPADRALNQALDNKIDKFVHRNDAHQLPEEPGPTGKSNRRTGQS